MLIVAKPILVPLFLSGFITMLLTTFCNRLERFKLPRSLAAFLHDEGRSLFDYLMKNGVITDWRKPNVIRLAPLPLYCSFEDMYEFGQMLENGANEWHPN